MSTSSDQGIVKQFQNVGASSSKLPPVARQSWGKNTDVKGISGDDGDKVNRSKGDAQDDDEDEEAKSLSDDDNDRSLEQRGTNNGARTGKKSRNQEDDQEGKVSHPLCAKIYLGDLFFAKSLRY